MTSYELWNIQMGRLVGGYHTEEAALAVMRQSITRHGHASVERLGLARESHGGTKTIAVGEQLAGRVLAADPSGVAPTPSAAPPARQIPASLRHP